MAGRPAGASRPRGCHTTRPKPRTRALGAQGASSRTKDIRAEVRPGGHVVLSGGERRRHARASELAAADPSTILPVPPQVGHAREPSRPEPRHSGQIFSPLLGVPGRAWSPGLSLALLLWMSFARGPWPCLRDRFERQRPIDGLSSPSRDKSNGPGAPPEAVQTSLPDKPTRPGASERRWPREGFTGPFWSLARTAVLRERTARSRGQGQPGRGGCSRREVAQVASDTNDESTPLMPIHARYRWFYPIDWPQLSAVIRF